MIDNSVPNWMALAHARSFSNKRKMQFLIECIHEKRSLSEAFSSIKSGDRLGFDFTGKEWNGIVEEAANLPNYAFLAEKLEDQGIYTINVMDKYVYPSVLKKNLKRESPLLIYGKGNMDLLKRRSVAIVGSRKSQQISLDFTDRVAKAAVDQNKVVVSGFAKGVDRQALDAALKYNGQSVVVLPQGIETYKSKTYYKDIIQGDVLILSTYHPKAKWSVGLAMDRNKIIYGLAEEIYAAESAKKGGTWEGVLNGLKRGRKIYVRYPDPSEKNANSILIQKGATPVDKEGNPITGNLPSTFTEAQVQYETSIPSNEDSRVGLVEQIIKELINNNGKGLTTNEIKQRLNLADKEAKSLSRTLAKTDKIIKRKKGRQNFYVLNESIPEQGDLFQ